MQKQNKKSVGKCGFTLVELSVVMALVAILATMTVSFTALMSGFANDSRAEYEYLEEYSNLKEEISKKLKEYDATDFNFFVENYNLEINGSAITDKVDFSKYDSIGGVKFELIDGKLIKCTTTRKNPEQTMSFVFYPRFATINGGGGQ